MRFITCVSGTTKVVPYVRSSGTTKVDPYVRSSETNKGVPYVLLAVILAISTIGAQQRDLSFREMRWRDIGPTRAGRARAAVGVPTQPNVFYAGFDNGGVWRSTDYGANWVPIFDNESTGSIGAIGVAASNPNVIYVGTGAGIIRPDLAIGHGMYKSTDGGHTWQHLGLRARPLIAR